MGSLRECALRGPYYHYYCRRFISIYCIYFYRPCAVSREALQEVQVISGTFLPLPLYRRY